MDFFHNRNSLVSDSPNLMTYIVSDSIEKSHRHPHQGIDTSHFGCGPVFQINLFKTLLLISFTLFPNPLTQGCHSYFRGDPYGVFEVHGNELSGTKLVLF